MKEKSSLELFAIALYEGGFLQGNGDEINDLLEQHKAMQQEQAQQYAEFCVMCDRNNLALLDFESFILTYGGNK